MYRVLYCRNVVCIFDIVLSLNVGYPKKAIENQSLFYIVYTVHSIKYSARGDAPEKKWPNKIEEIKLHFILLNFKV